MNPKFLPTEYHLEVYEDSFVNDASLLIQSSTPFSGIAVGDFFAHQSHDGWHAAPNTATEKFVVQQIEHGLWTVSTHNAHKLMLLVKKVSYSH